MYYIFLLFLKICAILLSSSGQNKFQCPYKDFPSYINATFIYSLCFPDSIHLITLLDVLLFVSSVFATTMLPNSMIYLESFPILSLLQSAQYCLLVFMFYSVFSSDMVIAVSFVIEFLFKTSTVLCMRKWLEGHVALSPKSKFRGQGIHTVISLRNLRDASLENNSGRSFEFCNWN